MNANELFSTLHISCLQGNLNDIKKNIVKEWINPNIKSQVSSPFHDTIRKPFSIILNK